ncbi:MetQ/NlpA family ABC transporter substrate-binding protein [Carnobacterium viridans]|uniref:Lipoprotein n=1 Tax=Carnobacterium viridans TaxID=174587 RepID=A0A1H1AH79_9LACT|nr:MetQ/NlpA family ABC transporter substrate-binding protein [Carnobacterium viridans]UDE96192.1 MetQ/NlpA family ABC transporter substrate-binding protein [Carnobacterium viridans]SDQ39054.1 D-methionine transport system substrate-binding protein [Carnobacterium viridans]
MKRLKKGFLGLTLALGLLVTTACGTDATSDAKASEPIKIGVVGEVNEVWDFVKEKLASDGVEIELVKFTDYATPNVALAEGELDLNSFQTKIFMDSFNEDHGENLVAIADTVIAPLGIYSSTIKDVSEIKENDVIAIPNDVSNEGRALLLLQTAGLIEVDPAKKQIPVVEDITSNPLNLTFETLDSSQTARALEDVTASVINSGMAVDAGFIPTEDAVFLEPVTESSDPYYNTIVSREEDKDNEVFQKIIEAYQAEDTKEVIAETSKGSSIPVW